MYAELYQYLLQHKELPVPGIGTFLLERTSAKVDFPNRVINPPAYHFTLQPGSHVPGQRFFLWLSAALHVSDRDAIFRFNDFAFDLKKQIGEGAVVDWNGVGILNKGLGGEVKFVPADDIVLERAVAAEKVLRERAEHLVRVGEDERTAGEMTEILGRKEQRKAAWWMAALAIAILSILFLGWHFSQHGLDTSAVSNHAPLKAEPAIGNTYKLIGE